jgi:hypothetical protein
VFTRLSSFIAAATLAAVLASAATAARVHVRVEGKTQTIYGATEPPLTVATHALDALDAASLAGEFYYHVTTASFGPYVDQIGRHPAAGLSGWVYKVNNAVPPVAANQAILKDGDRVLWYWATFGPAGGPPTLRLVRRPNACYQVVAEDDEGKTRPALGAALRVDGRRIRTRAARACIGPHRGLVRATLAGAVRSNAVR